MSARRRSKSLLYGAATRSSSDHGLGVENAEVECIGREYLRSSKVDIVSLDGRAQIMSFQQCSVAQTPGRTPVSVMTSGTNAKHPMRIQK